MNCIINTLIITPCLQNAGRKLDNHSRNYVRNRHPQLKVLSLSQRLAIKIYFIRLDFMAQLQTIKGFSVPTGPLVCQKSPQESGFGVAVRNTSE